MFINSKKNFEIIGEGGKLIIPRGFIGCTLAGSGRYQ